MTPEEFLRRAADICPRLITESGKMHPYTRGFRYGSGGALAVIIPDSLWQMWRIAELVAEADYILIPQAANTGLTGGSTPHGDYPRPVVILNTARLKGIRLFDHGRQALALPGATLFELEEALAPYRREPHSVIGSTCIGASVVGGICNNSGGALVRRGPAYTELALYARLDENGRLRLHNELDIDLGGDPETILRALDNNSYPDSAVRRSERRASDCGYDRRVRDIDAPTPARYNNDGRRLYGASGAAGRNLVFAVRVDTFAKPEREQVLYIATNDTAHLTDIRRHILSRFPELPISGEYLHRGFFDAAEKYGRDTYRIIRRFGTARIPKIYAFKNAFDRLCGKIPFLPAQLSEHISQRIAALLPRHLPRFMYDYRDRYEHHLILKMADDGIDAARAFLDDYFRTRPGEYRACNQAEGDAAVLHRFVCGGATARYRLMRQKHLGEMMSLDIALARNDREWFERLPPEIDAQIAVKLYCGHFFCHVMHQDYLLKKGVDGDKLKQQLLAHFDRRGAQYPAEHNVGHQYRAQEELRTFYRKNDPCNRFNPGIGKTPRGKYWQEDEIR